jgi:uncharacterized OsmC-like protein
MSDAERIRTFMTRSIKAISLRPAIGQHTAVSKVRVVDGLTCEIEEGRWTLTSDLSERSAGNGKGPDPGVLARAALGSCLAMGYVMWGAYRGVPLASVEVEVQADFDAGAQYGLGDAPPGYTEVRYNVSIESTAPDGDVMRIVDEAESNSPYFDVFTREQRLVRTVHISSPEEA